MKNRALAFYRALGLSAIMSGQPALCADVSKPDAKNAETKKAAGKIANAKKVAATKPNTKMKVWLLDQSTDNLGQVKVWVASDGIRIETVRSGLIITSRAPDWLVNAFMPRVKKYATSKFDTFRGSSLNQVASITRGDLANMPIELKRSTNTIGIKTDEYQTTKPFEAAQVYRYEHHDIHPSNVKHAVYQVSNQLGASQPACAILARYYGIPVVKGFPISLSFTRVSTGTIDLITTKSCQAKTVSQCMFAVPPSYVLFPSMDRLALESTSSKEGLGLIMQQMDSKQGFAIEDANR